ncbi:MAG: DUF3794 domain-containing protein, partial [Oscillospiraceae bacterium]|nr:DUF3794 domain-containing protein [Oscillospiraceae bacterium]
MEIELRKEQIQNYTRLYDQLICREESIEAVVPDVMPDVQQIMDAEAQVYLRGKETEDGRLSVSAFLEGTVLYQPEGENSLRRLNLSGNVSIAFDDPAIPRGGVVQLALGCTSADARMLNPRKVLLRAEICVRAIVFRPELSVYSAEAGAEGLQTLCKTETVQYIAAVEEKSFVLAEDFDLPGGGELHELLRSRLRLETGEVRAVAGKLIVQGNACLDILYCAAAGELPRTASFSAAFSQIVDVHGEYGGPCSVDLVPTALYVEPVNGSYGGATVSMELHLVAQALCADEREIRYLADAYSNACPCQVELAPLRLGGIGHSTLLRETVRETLECGESIAEVLEACAVAGRAAATDGKLRVPVSVHVLCRGERG